MSVVTSDRNKPIRPPDERTQAIIRRQNIWRDSTLIDGLFFKSQFERIKQDFPECAAQPSGSKHTVS